MPPELKMTSNSPSIEERVATLEKELQEIRLRNLKVENDKSWEISRFRVLLVAIIAYVTCGLVFIAIGVTQPFLSSLIPTVGYVLST